MIDTTFKPISIQSAIRNPQSNMSQSQIEMSESAASEVVVVKKPTLPGKFKEFAALSVWVLDKICQSGLVPADNVNAIYAQINLFSSVDEQVVFWQEFVDNKKDQLKLVAKIVKEHNHPPKAPKAKKVAAEVDPNKPKRGRAKKVVVKVDSPEDDVIAQLVAAANNTENIVVSREEEVAVVIEEAAPVVVVETKAPVKSKKPVAANAEEKAAAKVVAEQEKAAAKAKLEQEKAAAKALAEEKKAATKLVAEQEKAAKAEVAAKAKAAKEAEKAAKEAEKATKTAKKQVAVVPVPVVVPELVPELVAEEEEEMELGNKDDSESEGGQLDCSEIEQDGETYLVSDDGDVYNVNAEELTNLVYFEGRIQAR